MEIDKNLPEVLVTRNLPDPAYQILNGKVEIDSWEEDDPMPREKLLERLKGKTAVICLLSDRMDREAIDSGRDLKVIANYAVGYDNIDVEYATENNIAVINTPGVLTAATADLAFALLLAAARRIGESDRYVRDGRFKQWGPKLMLGKDVWKATLGVIGAGKIGRAVLRRGKGFEMNLLYYSRNRKKDLEEELGARYVNLKELLRESDFVSLNCPLTDETRHMIGPRELEMMKDDAVLINTARGPVVDEEALENALKNGIIGSAGLDVYEREPRVHPGLLELENVVLAPHIGSSTHTTRNAMAELVARGTLEILSGNVPQNLVNPEIVEGESNDRS